MGPEVVLSWLISRLLTQCSFIIQSEISTIYNSTGELHKLKSVLTAILAVLSDAEGKQLKNSAINKWLSEIRDVAYDAQDVLDEYQFEILTRRVLRQNSSWASEMVRRLFTSRNPLLFRRKMGRLVKQIVNRLDEIARLRSRYNLVTSDNLEEIYNVQSQTSSFIEQSDVIGRDKDRDFIIETLISEKFTSKDVSVLPIIGMGGIGKTTLAQLVFNDNRVETLFDIRIWVSVGDNFDVMKICRCILESVTQKACLFSQLDLFQGKIRETLRGKRCFLVLDDVWNEDVFKWEGFRSVFTSVANGSIILVTTQSMLVGSVAGTIDTYQLAPLSEHDCWLIFKRRAFHTFGGEEPQNLVLIGKEIVRKCVGFPLACKALGALMGTKREEREWTDMLESEIWELQKDSILNSLKISYHHLPTHLKRCFAFCALFPKGHQINKDMLIHLWMANGFLPEMGRSLEEIGRNIFNELVCRSFFQDVKKIEKWYDCEVTVSFKMHDMMVNLARSISMEECYYLGEDGWVPDSKIRHLGVNLYSDLAHVNGFSHIRKLRSLVLINHSSNQIPHQLMNALCMWKCLRSLDLSHSIPPNKDIPLYHLKHLRYLNLSYMNIGTVPESVSHLLHLQTLNLNHCEALRELPKDMKNLGDLRHLYLTGCTNLRKMPVKMGQLRQLRTLTKFVVCPESGCSTLSELRDLKLEGILHLGNLQNLKSVADAKASLDLKENIEGLYFEWVLDEEDILDVNEELFEALKPPKTLKMLGIKGYCGKLLPTWLLNDWSFFRNLTEMSLSCWPRVEFLPCFEEFPLLKVLEIHEMKKVKKIGDKDHGGSGSFPSLCYLKLTKMASLVELFGLEKRPHMAQPFKLKIKNCPQLTIIPVIPTVREVEIENCSNIDPSEGFVSCMICLEKLVLSECDSVVLLLEREKGDANMPVKELTIKRCTKRMFNRPPQFGLWRSFVSLSYLSFESCGGLVFLPDIVMKQLQFLKYLIIFCCLNLIGSSENDGLQLQYLTSLEKLSIIECNRLLDFPENAMRHLSSLKFIELVGLREISYIPELPITLTDAVISGCTKIYSLPDNMHQIKSLARLQIMDLPNLISLPEEMLYLTGLEKLIVINCRNLEKVPKGLGKSVGLKCLRIKDCPMLEGETRSAQGETIVSSCRFPP
ncbi:hypothetical protein LUZ61_003408 [Rhynchospora tenuis]|uniref:Disease resistance protein RGA3 n=1 Tax=Rhynchospora tenuis TaxID=198213 RepID=A0AAD6ESL7_9POAL|nr:hypothetical protein LUZ61_003408 [Rhynchospora tenuis]